MRQFWCCLIGHIPSKVNTEEQTATCQRCLTKLRVSYDMGYGETVVVGTVESE